MPIGIIASLIICTVLYVLMSAVLTGIKNTPSMPATPLLLPPLSRANRGRRRW
jgi:amino acid transporter